MDVDHRGARLGALGRRFRELGGRHRQSGMIRLGAAPAIRRHGDRNGTGGQVVSPGSLWGVDLKIHLDQSAKS
jgi:hypothetical protein